MYVVMHSIHPMAPVDSGDSKGAVGAVLSGLFPLREAQLVGCPAHQVLQVAALMSALLAIPGGTIAVEVLPHRAYAARLRQHFVGLRVFLVVHAVEELARVGCDGFFPRNRHAVLTKIKLSFKMGDL